MEKGRRTGRPRNGEKESPAAHFTGIDDTALNTAFASGDEAAVNREWNIWIAKLEAKAAKDPVFAKWFEEFRSDQEILLDGTT